MAHNGNQFTQGQEPTAAAPTPSPALDDEMLEGSGSDSDSSDDENNDTNQAEDDAALRTVFEAGLKDNVKDGLVHHDKPDTLHKLVELATRIDNQLWERAQQKGRFQPTVANMKKQRNRTDRDGDTVMTSKVQDKRHFRRDCPKNETSKQAIVKVKMIRLSTPYPRHDLTLEDNLSDVDLYNEARRATSPEYVVIPKLAQPSIEWDVPQAED
ncbi:uncharacterized protein SETTUDRAFT_25274 [Exserohilum turcica Et28A]|uniref:Uncharacterized protein n=1 Tax=Exserohilum turcicum (strain 28A) TaxID=671987 RepID=R0KAJ7_EXST2|nr:uncharacterized protein SETTUDRAFT_25274 [Exserohilum turcica Et28A]EOA89993.1 hypothetical protein SETTUDRAFT_25274 [Exserohilum turcica Et28A]